MFSGVGVGMMINGEIYRGATGAAGELGIVSQNPSHTDVVAASATHLGRWAMDLGMAHAAREKLKDGRESLIKDFAKGNVDAISIKEVIQALKERDPLAIEIIEDGARHLGRKIGFLVNLLNPEIVVIGGGIEDCGAIFMETLKHEVKAWAVEESANYVKIIPSAFGENSVALGVVGIVAREVFAQA